MRLLLLPILIIVIINILVDYYIHKSLKESVSSKRINLTHAGISVFLLLFIILAILLPKRNGSNESLVIIMWMLFTYLSIYLSKFLFVVIDLFGKISLLFKKQKPKYVTNVAVIAACVLFATLWFGALYTSRSYEIRDVNIYSERLPKEFNGFKIVQFSDFHLGTYGSDTAYVSRIVDRINSLHPQMIVFSGDLVNRQTSELYPFVDVLSRLHAPYGVYSVLGNHDYGDYMDWVSQSEKERNNIEFIELQKKMGWKMLNNDNVIIKNKKDSITIIGVENWGDPPFPRYGNLKRAYPSLNDSLFKILVSHNPCHWEAEVVPNTNIDLTLSGHTHAMQFEIDAFGKRISPAEMRYKEWGGLYYKGSQMLYVNIGLGEVALPMRVGATPEITLITLRRDVRR